jgi:hypothetical protein
LAGRRLTHRQAKAALPIALLGEGPPIRYGEVALLTSIYGDDLLTTSLLAGGCPSYALLSADFTVTSPNPLYVVY